MEVEYLSDMAISSDNTVAAPPHWRDQEGTMVAEPLQLVPQHAPQGRVIEHLKQWMKEGVLSSGSPLPSERALSEQFQVTRGTVRRALQILQDEGLLRTQNGRTRIVTQQTRRAGALRNTVALVTPLFTDTLPDDRYKGRREFIGRGTLEGIRQIGKHTMALNPDCLTRAEVDELAREYPYGVVITEISPDTGRELELASWFQEAGTPVTVYGDSPAISGFDRVLSDHADGSYQLTRFLIERGCRRILNLWSAPASSYWNIHRFTGYRKAMMEAGLEPLEAEQIPTIPETGGDRELFQAGVRSMVGYVVEHLLGPEPVEAFLLSTDTDHSTVAAACRLCGKEPQRDVLLVGYDNQWMADPNLPWEPSLPMATVDKRNSLMGAALVELLSQRVNGQLAEEPQKRVVQPVLVQPAPGDAPG